MLLSTKQSLLHHWHRWHRESATDLEECLREVDAQGKTHVCPTCGKLFSRSNICKDHQQKAHGENDLKRKARFTCPVPECTSPSCYYFAKDLLQHCTAFHQHQLGQLQLMYYQHVVMIMYYLLLCIVTLLIGVQELEFSNWEEFLQWKTAEEALTNAYYIQVSKSS